MKITFNLSEKNLGNLMVVLAAMVGALSKQALLLDNPEIKQLFQSAIEECEKLDQRISAGEDIDINLIGAKENEYLELETQFLGRALAYGCLLQFEKNEKEKQ